MTVIKQDDLIQSVADALQFISYYHPVDFIQAMHEAYLKEESPAARLHRSPPEGSCPTPAGNPAPISRRR